jgi:hypothetical protein
MRKLLQKSLFMFLWILLLTVVLTYKNSIVTKAIDNIPKLSIVSLDHSPFIEGDTNEFYISSTDYSGEVQYQLFYTCEATMGSNWKVMVNEDMIDGWTKPSNAKEVVKVNITNLNLKAEYYRFAIRVRRVGIQGKYSNKYGDYDNSYPFTINVLKNANINFNGQMLINKTEYSKSEFLNILGVNNNDSSTKYKLHLYDVKNSKWFTNLTDYATNINYSIKNIPEGTYIVDIWGKKDNSSNKYDGWKLKVINIRNETLPEVAIVSLDHSPFKEGDNNELYISSKGYHGEVQYQLFYTCETTMDNKWELINNADMVNGWTSPVNAHVPVTVNIGNLNLKADYYRFSIRVRRTATEGKYKNQYGDYDFAYPFTMNVLKSGVLDLKNEMLIDKVSYAQNDQMVINGVNKSEVGSEYKLHLYDVTNNKWLTNLTDYNSKIDYDLSNVPPGTYIVDIWGRAKDSLNKYDGWKLKVINITSDLITINSVEDLTGQVLQGSTYRLPRTTKAIMEGGRNRDKAVAWESIADTSTMGEVTYYGTVKGYDKKVKFTLRVDERRGNSSGNIINLGIVAQRDDLIYYSNYSDEGKLYKIKEDGSNITKISNDASLYINIMEDWVYYFNYSDGGKLYKIKIDGTGRTKLNDDVSQQVTVLNEWIYYVNASDNNRIYKIRTNGTSRTKVNNDSSVNINVVDAYIYYTNLSDANKIYKIKTDGLGRVKLNNDQSGFINVADGWIYYANASDSQKIYKITTNGTDKTKVKDQEALFINVKNGYIYYSNAYGNNLLSRIKIDGTEETMLNESESIFFNVINDYIYFENNSDNDRLYRIKNNGQEQEEFGIEVKNINNMEMSLEKNVQYSLPETMLCDITDGSTRNLKVSWDVPNVDTSKIGEYVFTGTVKGYNNKVILRLKIIERVRINNEITYSTRPRGAKFNPPYYAHIEMSDGSIINEPITWETASVDTNKVGEYIFRGTIEGEDTQFISYLSVVYNKDTLSGVPCGEDSEWIYYYNIYDNKAVYKMKKDGSGKVKITSGEVYVRGIKDGWVYYTTTDSGPLYGISTDGNQTIRNFRENAEWVNIVGDYIYYINYNTKKLRRAKLDQSEFKVLSSDNFSNNRYVIYNDWIFYGNSSDGDKLYKMRIDGTGKVKVTDDLVYTLKIVDDYVYFHSKDSNFIKVKIDGTNKSIITKNATDNEKIINGWIYYIEFNNPKNASEGNRLVKIKIDGSGKTYLSEYGFNMYISEIVGEWIYYINGSDMGRVRIDGTGNTIFTNVKGFISSIRDGWIYYSNYEDDSMWYKMKLDGTENQIVM